MIYEGTDLKYRVTTAIEGFSLEEDNFSITIKNRWGVVQEISKEQCIKDTEGGYLFTLDELPKGTYRARFRACREDEDFEDNEFNITDEQVLVRIGVGPCECTECECMEEEADHPVRYTEVYLVNTSCGMYLADRDGEPILDRNGEKIYVNTISMSAKTRLDMSAEEVKYLLEGRNGNGRIDSVPEMMDALQGITDSTVITPQSDEEAEEMAEDIARDSLMTDDDIDGMMDRILNR